MSNRRNLQKAVLLGLLAASISMPVWAAEIAVDDFVSEKTGQIIVTEDTVVIGNGTESGDSDTVGNSLYSKVDNQLYNNKVIVNNGSTITFENVAMINSMIDSNGKVIIADTESADGMPGGLYITGNVKAAELDITNTTNGGKGIYVYGGRGENDDKMTINVDGGVKITSAADGIFTNNSEKNGLTMTAGNIYIDAASRNGIYNSGAMNDTDKQNDIILTAKDGDITILSNGTSDDTAGVKSKNKGETKLTSENGNIYIGQVDDEGMLTTVGANTNGVYAAAGITELNAAKNNVIYATQNGTYATGADTVVTLSAENNTIYVDNNDGGATGVHAENSATENVFSEGKTEIIVAGSKDNILGIHADKNSTVNVDAGSLSIDVTSKGSSDREVSGIWAGDLNNQNGNATVSATVDGDIDIDVHAVKCNANGIRVNVNSSVDLTSANGDITIKVNDNPTTEGYNANKFGIDVQNGGTADITAQNGSVTVVVGEEGKYTGNNNAVYAQNSNINITAEKDVTLNSYSLGESGSANGGGILAQNGKVVVNAGGTFSIHSESDKNIANSGNYALQASIDGSYTGDNKVGIDIEAAKVDISSTGNSSHAIMINNGAELDINAGVGGINVQANGGSGDTWALYVDKAPEANLITSGNITLTATNDSAYQYAYGITSGAVDNANNLTVDGAQVGISVENKQGGAIGINVQNRYYASEQWPEEYVNKTDIVSDKDIIVNVTSGNSTAMGINVYNSDLNLTSETGSAYITANGTDSYGILAQSIAQFEGEIAGNSNINVASAVNNYVESSGTGIASWYDNSVVNLTAETGSNQVQANSYGIYNFGGAQTSMTADNGFNTVSSQNSYAVYNNGAAGNVVLQAQGNSVTGYHGIVGVGGNIDLTAATVNNELTAEGNGIYATTKADVDLSAEQGINYLEAGASGIAANIVGIYADDSTVDLQAKANTLNIAADADGYGSKHAVKAANQAIVNLNATAGNNEVAGVIYAKDAGTVVTLNHNVADAEGNVTAGSGDNIIMSSTHGSEDNIGDRSHVVAALYAQSKGKINVTAGEGGVNYIASDYTFEHEEDSEHTVWAQRGGIIEIKGSTIIESSNAENYYAEGGYNTNSRGIAITAGSDEIITDEDDNMVTVADEDRSRVNLEYGADSAIYGDIVSGYGGWVNVKAENGGSLNMQGNALAGNGGILNLEIADGSTWYGRADDYGDAGYGEDAQNKQDFYNPAFSNAITEGGQVNITMGEGSTWYLTGQSWVSSLDVSNGNGNVTIDMQEFNEGTHGLTIAEMTGKNDGTIDATFVMSLNHDDHGTSDMLYIKNGTGEYDVVLKEAIDGMENINEDNVLRFATVQGGAQFNSVTMDNVGLYNLGFEIDHSEYDTAATEENEGYNGASVDENKPGNENVEEFFDISEEENQPEIMLLADQNQKADDGSVQNWFITRVSGQEISDAGKTVVAMSKVNYSNAVYMDRLNKRLGEARYINNEEDQGMWVRLRHDRIGKSDEFRSMNTMYELGYDEKQECDNGERRVGAAIDYMDGSSEYTNVAGTGDISRKGIWLYDTWMGDKGHYADYVAKWGHLFNDFKLYRDGKEITGDYSNNVYSISAEYGRKKDIGHDWYFEPQVQLQYARVTDASYTTSQGTDVELDAINSLIARAGFRLGKDLSERSTVYFKADVLHEFLGDQDIYAHDATGEMDVTYGNEGTWCDVGFGFAAAMSKNSYVYLDFEKSFGNDFDETYQINAGMQWSF